MTTPNPTPRETSIRLFSTLRDRAHRDGGGSEDYQAVTDVATEAGVDVETATDHLDVLCALGAADDSDDDTVAHVPQDVPVATVSRRLDALYALPDERRERAVERLHDGTIDPSSLVGVVEIVGAEETQSNAQDGDADEATASDEQNDERSDDGLLETIVSHISAPVRRVL
ncbi:hypothetical protein [Halarchaeum sp. P4]|uniref:hypothetical protein n=1 Tax=Halarchaeum sp. P4 TaxID=3421639 RepID=UPI003EB806B2